MKKLSVILLSLVLSGCVAMPFEFQEKLPEKVAPTKFKIPFPEPESGQPIVVAVYNFLDRTGQKKDSPTVAKFSSAVTQGAETLLLKALADVGDGKWFRIVERVGLDNLLKERQLIRSAREESKDPKSLGPILYAGMIIEGGIVGYDSSTKSGGNAYRMLGIGPQTQYSEDIVTVSLRAVSVNTGKVLVSVTVQKIIYSASDSLAILKFVKNGTQAFEFESGLTINEPGTLAVKTTIEAAVVELLKEGEKKGVWEFKQKEKEENK